jgi:hypothetical protein
LTYIDGVVWVFVLNSLPMAHFAVVAHFAVGHSIQKIECQARARLYLNILILDTFVYKVVTNINIFRALNNLFIIYYFNSCLIILISNNRLIISFKESKSAEFNKEFK